MSFNVDKLREKLKNKEKKGSGNNDPRFLNYYNLDYGQQMTIRLLPDGGNSDDLWLTYSMHGPNLDNPNVDSISCAKSSSGERCPACTYSYAFHKEGMKDDAKKWRTKETFIAQCIVVESPIEINQSPDGNMVKLVYLPFGIKEQITEAILNQTISDPTACDFVIKKTKNAGGKANYDKSFFKTKESDYPQSFVESMENGTSYLYDLSKELPEPANAEQVGAWLEKAIETVSNTKPNVARPTTATAAPVAAAPVAAAPVADTSSTENIPTSVPVQAKVSAKDLLAKLNRKPV